MTASFLFIADPLAVLKPAKDSSIAMMRELARRGHSVLVCTPRDLIWDGSEVRARTTALTLPATAHFVADRPDLVPTWYVPAAAGSVTLADCAAVLMRKDPPFDAEYLYATHLLSAAERAGARVYNAPSALRRHNEKLAILEFPAYTPPTLVSSDAQEILAFQASHGELVVKPLDGMGGSGIFRLRPGDPNTNVILETATCAGGRTVMAQRFLPAIAAGDKRILLVAGQPVPYALARLPKPGESRGNLAAGGSGRVQALSARDRQIAAALGPVLAERGLLLVGLDVIGDSLTEINVTSPTCFVEITQQSGFDVAAAFVDALEAELSAGP